MEQTYGVEILEPGSKDVTMYKRYEVLLKST